MKKLFLAIFLLFNLLLSFSANALLEMNEKIAETEPEIGTKVSKVELLVKVASKLLEEDQRNKDLLELEIAALKEAEAQIQYRQLLVKEIQDEQDTARSLIIEDQLNKLQNAYIYNLAARVRASWRYQSAEDDWTAEVYVVQDRDGNVKAVDVKNAMLVIALLENHSRIQLKELYTKLHHFLELLMRLYFLKSFTLYLVLIS